MLLWNAIGAACIVSWNFVITLAVCLILKKFNLLRVREKDELNGLDFSKKHNEPAYTGGQLDIENN
jgi:ammonia channel protein AmtB